jgi:hypothetical protein
MTGAHNMSSTKKRARSPEAGGPSSTRQNQSQSTSVQTHENQNPRPPKKRRWRGPKDGLKALLKLERERDRRLNVFRDTASQILIARAPQLAPPPPPVKFPLLQPSPGPAVQHSPPSLPAEGDKGEPESFNGPPVRPRVSSAPDSRKASGIRDTRALLRQVRHLDDDQPDMSAWNRSRNNQANHWTSVAIPRLVPIYLANRKATESGRLPPPPPKPNGQCRCKKVAIQVEMVAWDRKFSPHLLQLFANWVLHQDPRNRRCLTVNAIQLVHS